jgi:ElaB/YqjD/DUF883 family membrane-anchored ribosome-binding protein
MSTAKTLDLIDELRAVVADAQAVLSGQGAEALEQGKAGLAELASDARARAEELREEAARYVREHPWQSVGIAAGLGVMLGVLLARR